MIARRHVTYDWIDETEPVRDLLVGSETLSPSDRSHSSLDALRALLHYPNAHDTEED